MKPTALFPNHKVLCGGRVMTFVRRDRAYCGRSAVNVFQCDDYRGLNGPEDKGICTMSDPYVVRHVSPIKEAA